MSVLPTRLPEATSLGLPAFNVRGLYHRSARRTFASEIGGDRGEEAGDDAGVRAGDAEDQGETYAARGDTVSDLCTGVACWQ